MVRRRGGVEGDHVLRAQCNVLLAESEVPEHHVTGRRHSVGILQAEGCMCVLLPSSLRRD